ncbi:MAG: tRNA (cytidine(34)-2'-O)-methyltransferase [Thiobacillus sp.]|nr:tRNA (cytidine(34)-2'-O)-methyltransferase [Thiobacillus sp.]
MFDIVLYQPEIPPNTGNLIRLAANTGCRLHLVEPLGFDLSDKQVARAGLDYHDMACVQVHADWAAVLAALPGRRWFALTTKGSARYADHAFQADDVFVFGPESRGLPAEILAQFNADRRLRLPMLPGSRSMNLSNAVSVVVFEAWRQNGFAGGA